MEIERKLLLNYLPENLDGYEHYLIEQGYISTTPVIRIRKKITATKAVYILTAKSSGLLKRQEFELELTEDEYNSLSKKVCGNIITKTRYLIPLDASLTLELDCFSGAFEGLIMGEIEFNSEEQAKSYVPGDMFGAEVTYDTRFHNSTMSSMSKSEISDFITSLHPAE